MDQFIPIITDPYYFNSSWFKAMHQTIIKTALIQKKGVKVCSTGLSSVEINQLPEVVVLASGVLAYIQSTIAILQAHGKKIILAGLSDDAVGTEVSSVSAATRYDVQMVIDYLHACERHNIAIVGFREHGMNDIVRSSEMIKYTKMINCPINESDVFFRGNSMEKCIRKFFDEIYRYDAVISPNGATAIYLLNYCKQNGVEIPDDLFVISFNDMNIANYSSPSLTCVDSDLTTIGRKVVTLWNYMKEHSDENIVINQKVRSILSVRESTASIPFTRKDRIGLGNAIPPFVDKYYENPVTNSLFNLESEMQGCDQTDYCIIRMIVRGLSYEQMTEEVFMSISGVRYRVKRLFDKLHVNSRMELIKKIIPLLGKDIY